MAINVVLFMLSPSEKVFELCFQFNSKSVCNQAIIHELVCIIMLMNLLALFVIIYKTANHQVIFMKH